MTAIHQHGEQGSLLAEIEMQEWYVTPGKSTYIPVRLLNRKTTTKILHLSVKGIPAHWLEVVPEKIVALPNEQKEIALVIQPPDAPMTQTGHYPIQISVTEMENGHEAVVLEGVLTVAAYEVQGRVGILMDALHYTVAPGSAVTVHFKLINQGLEEDTFRLTVDGIQAAWISTATPSLHLHPGEQKLVSIQIHPARHFQSRAGRHPFKLQIESQLNPTETAIVDCVLTIDAFSEFRSQLKPEQVSVGENVQVAIENVGNTPDSYTLTWASTDKNLGFEWVDDPLPENYAQLDENGVVKVRILPGETIILHFHPKLQSGSSLIGNRAIPFHVNIASANDTIQAHTGEVLSQGLIPIWIVHIGILLMLGAMCLASFFFARGNLVSTQATETALASLNSLTQTVEISTLQSAGATQTAFANITQTPGGGQQDSDSDGLTNDQEAQLGTDPLLADTDGDALTDGDEVQRGTNPLNGDTDTDLSSDGQEIQVGTDPFNPDSDADGVLDGNEILPCPSPLNPDSDGDGLIDGQDIEPCDPNNPSLTATAIASNPTETPIPIVETPTEVPTVIPTELATGTPVPTVTTVPQIPPLEGILAFISTRDGNPEIYTLNLGNGSFMRLTMDPAVEAQPSWSPDGRHIAFATNRDGNFEVYVMNADGTGLVNLTNQSSDDFDPAWSPDGSQIAFVSNRDGNNEIYLINTDGTLPYNATSNPANDSQPSWFIQNGLIPTVRIAFTSDRDGNEEIYSMNPSGIDQTNLSNNPTDDHSPSAFPDNGPIAFTTDRDGNEEIYVLSLDGTSLVNLTNSPSADWASDWVSTTDWLAFVSSRDGNQEIYVVNGSEFYNLTTNSADDYDPAWGKP